MKRFITLTVLCAVVAIAGNTELHAQGGVKSRYGGVFPEAAANQPSPLLNNKTLLEQRDYGVDLFITGIVLNAVVTPIIFTLGLGLAGPLAFTFSDSSLVATTLTVSAVAGGIIGAIGFGLWVAGVAYWSTANNILARGLVLSERPDGTPGVVLGFDTQVNGLGAAIRY